MIALLARIGVVAQSAPPEPTTGSNAAVLIIGVILVTVVIGIVVARRSKR